jgi:hypothetical protein
MPKDTHDQKFARPLDPYSFALGIIFAFSEVVAAGIKQLALSEPATPEAMQAILPEAMRIAERHNVKMHLEADLIQTDLFPPEAAEGMHVLLIYRGDILDQYLALKAEQKHLIEGRAYADEMRRRIAVKFGKLLSYSDERIKVLIAQNGPIA